MDYYKITTIQPGHPLKGSVVHMLDVIKNNVPEDTLLGKIARQCVHDWLEDLMSANPSMGALGELQQCMTHPYFQEVIEPVLNEHIHHCLTHDIPMNALLRHWNTTIEECEIWV